MAEPQSNSTRSENGLNFGFAQRSETWLAASVLVGLALTIVPLPTFLLDMCLALNLSAAILLLLVTLNAKKPLDLAVFPSILLLLTLFRLSLNVATTRLILLEGDAGKIVDTFGGLVAGGDLVVGIVIFLILVTIQFIVITKGATRISEVNARFTLDALPGKQMAIDAEMNAGAISEEQARAKRKELAAEAEFYGAMDGASKYVRGDSIAGLIIMAVNIIGGVIIALSAGKNIDEAFRLYSILTIGDGLVSQIPALIIATSAGMLVTKSSSGERLGDEIEAQLTKGSGAMMTGGIILFCLALVPQMPKFPFFFLSAVLFALYVRNSQLENAPEEEVTEETSDEPELSPVEQNLNQFLQNDRIVVEMGVGLIGLVKPRKGKGLADRIAALRRDIANQNGFWVPNVRIRDNLQLSVNEYRILISGRSVGKDELRPNEFLAIASTGIETPSDEYNVIDPAFNLPAKWISSADRRRAEIEGLMVVDAPTVLITHLGEVIRKNACELLSREDLQKMLDKLKDYAPTIVSELKPDTLRPGVLHQLLLKLMREFVPITALESIIESAVHHSVQTKDINLLYEKVRGDLGAIIVEKFRNEVGNLRVIAIEPQLEHFLREQADEFQIPLQPVQLKNLVEAYQQAWEITALKEQPACAMVDSSLRRQMRQTLYRSLPEISFVAYNEIPGDLRIEPVTVIRFQDVVQGQNMETQTATKLEGES